MRFPWHRESWKKLVQLVDRLPHALLIYGPSGIGKRAFAERFAQFLLCEARTAGGEPCGTCDGCRWFVAGSHPDVRRVEPEILAKRIADDDETPGQRSAKPSSEIKVDQVRELADFLAVGSHRARLRVALVHPAEDMNLHAANALLKSLEEPPPGAVFILVSHRSAKLLPTVRSRCIAVPMHVPETAAALEWLAAQGLDDGARWLAFAGGAPLRALDYGRGQRSEAILGMLETLASGQVSELAARVETREDLALMAEVLQKFALDKAWSSAQAAPRYRTVESKAAQPSHLHEWLGFARRMGRERALAGHPLNPKLFAAEMLAAMPGLQRDA
jgi:DNA polymerase-3 subunit delta'